MSFREHTEVQLDTWGGWSRWFNCFSYACFSTSFVWGCASRAGVVSLQTVVWRSGCARRKNMSPHELLWALKTYCTILCRVNLFQRRGGSTNSANVFITTFVSDLSLAYGAPEGMLGEKTKTEQKTNKPIRNTWQLSFVIYEIFLKEKKGRSFECQLFCESPGAV